MAGRKNFISGSILTAADVNSFLMDQAVMVFDDDTARGSAIPSPVEGMVTYRKDAKLVEAFNGTAFTPVGRILQVVNTIKADVFSTTSTSFTDLTGMSVSITPSATTSKVLVFFALSVSNGSVNSSVYVNLVRDSTNIAQSTGGATNNQTSAHVVTATLGNFFSAVQFLDSPNTTSATTYKLQIRTSSGTAFVNRRGADGGDGLVCTMTAMEVAG